jgi:uncharacterized protein (TIGR02646 family)
MAGNVPGGDALVSAFAAQLALNPAAGGSRATAFEFDGDVYADAAVKSALKRTQFDKCCYCEGRIMAWSPGDVEHFRPKTRVQQRRRAPLQYPGYYWLAYRWENLLFACDICNRSNKRNLFPLANPALRCTGPGNPLAQEHPLLVHPVEDDPRDHIRFKLVVPIGHTAEGRETIDVLGLKRAALKKERVSRLKRARGLIKVAILAASAGKQAEVDRAMHELKRMTLPGAPFSSMVIDYLDACSISFPR